MNDIEIIITGKFKQYGKRNMKRVLSVSIGDGYCTKQITDAEAKRIIKTIQPYLRQAAEDHVRRQINKGKKK